MTAAAGGWTKGPVHIYGKRGCRDIRAHQRKVGFIFTAGLANDEEDAANAALIAEAFNVATETGLSPRQLAEQRDELLTAAVCVLGHMTGNMDGNMDLGDPVEMLRCAIDKAALDRTKEGAL